MNDITAPPELPPPPALRTPRVQRFTLKNGLLVLFVPMDALPIVDIQVIVRTGAVADPRHLAGLTSLAADMLDEGAGGRDAIEIAQAIEDLGASLSAGAAWDDITFGIHAHSDRIDAALDILGDVIVRPSIEHTEFERKKTQRLDAILQQQDEPRVLAALAFADIVFGGAHPYGLPISGTRTTVSAIQRDDVVRFHSTWVRPSNAFVVVAGNITRDHLEPALERAFGSWQDAAVPALDVPPAPAAGPAAIHVVDRPGSPQSELRVGSVGVARNNPDFFPLLVMNTILGGAFTSRLNLNLRQDKGYTYGAGSSFAFRLWPGPFTISTAVDTHVTADAIRQIMIEVARIRDEPTPQDELDRATAYIALGLPRSFETTSDIANHIAEAELYDLGADYFDRYVDQVRAVTAADVQHAARTYLDPAQLAVVVAGDFDAIHRSLDGLGIGQIHRRNVEE